MAYGESKDERDRRIAKLWETLDTRREGQIGFSGLKKGLRKIDHPLKNADNMLRSVMQAVDTNGDGQIQYDGKITYTKDGQHLSHPTGPAPACLPA